MDNYFGQVWLTRLVLQRGMAAIYCVAFLTVIIQFKPLLGANGLLPVPAYLRRSSIRESPSIFFWRYTDRLAMAAGWAGLIVAVCTLLGLTEAGQVWLSVAAWLLLYGLYLSFVNVGQKFFGFGWESMLLEAGFFTAFLGPARIEPSIVPILVLRWMLFRTELGAGLIKLRHDPCWRNLTCLYYHYETQPLPNPLSWYFHRLPKPVHRFAAAASHVIQVVVPFFLFAPQPVASIAAGLTIFHQLVLIVSGNYSWLNWLTVVLGVAGLDDQVLRFVLPLDEQALASRPMGFDALLYLIGAGTVLLSIRPVLNLFSADQVMNRSYNPFHLVGTYGAFGTVGRERFEIVIEGTDEGVVTPHTVWKEYEFKGKPGHPLRRPPQVAPYHLRLDWLIWFLPFSVAVTGQGIRVWRHDLWFVRYVKKLLQGDKKVLRLMRTNPFPQKPPMFVRALFYRYQFADQQQRRARGAWWVRELLGIYLEAVKLETLREI